MSSELSLSLPSVLPTQAFPQKDSCPICSLPWIERQAQLISYTCDIVSAVASAAICFQVLQSKEALIERFNVSHKIFMVISKCLKLVMVHFIWERVFSRGAMLIARRAFVGASETGENPRAHLPFIVSGISYAQKVKAGLFFVGLPIAQAYLLSENPFFAKKSVKAGLIASTALVCGVFLHCLQFLNPQPQPKMSTHIFFEIRPFTFANGAISATRMFEIYLSYVLATTSSGYTDVHNNEERNNHLANAFIKHLSREELRDHSDNMNSLSLSKDKTSSSPFHTKIALYEN